VLKAKVGDLMSENIVKIKESATIKDAAHILLRFQINGLVVTSEDGQSSIGVITTTDLLRLLDRALSRSVQKMAALDQISKLRIGAVASKRVIKIQKSAKIERVVNLMRKKNVHTIPVYDGRKLVGVIGKHDVINAAFYPQRT